MNWMLYGTLALACVGLSYGKIKMRESFLKELSVILYKNFDANAYLSKLESFKAKWLLDHKTRLFMSVEGYLLKNQIDQVIKIFKEMESKRLSFSKKLGLYKREVEVYMDAKLNDEALEANKKLQALSQTVNHSTVNIVAEELNDLVEINILHNADLAEKMVEKASSSSSDLIKEVYYYRAAKCYYFKKNQDKIDKYLKKAHSASRKTIWSQHIEACMQDNNNFLLR